MRILTTAIAICIASFTFAQSKLVVKGKIENGAGNSVFLHELVNNKPVQVDSTQIDRKGKYELETAIDKMTFFRMHIRPDDFVILVADENTGEITVDGDMTGLAESYTVQGSEHSLYTKEFLGRAKEFVTYKDSVSAAIQANNQIAQQANQKLQELHRSGEQDKARLDSAARVANEANNDSRMLQAEFGKKSQVFIEYRNKFIDDHPNSPAVLTTLSYLNPQQDFDYYKKVVEVAQTTMPGSFYDQQLSTQLAQVEAQEKAREEKARQERERAERLKPGKEAPELEYNNPDGEPIALSDLKGKVVLIDFWASWCGPCRRENPNVVKLYNEYKDDGFTIYSVSLDQNKDRWLQAIEKDNLAWDNHVSDLKGWGSEAAQIYGVTGIPFTVLIDEEGKIIATRLRGPALEQKLAEIFGS